MVGNLAFLEDLDYTTYHTVVRTTGQREGGQVIAVIVNTCTVIIGSLLGLVLKSRIPEKVSQTVMTAIGLCVIYIGVDGALAGENTIVLIVSMVLGTIVGSLIDIDAQINRCGTWIESKMRKQDGKTSVAEGFMTASLLFCVGAMTIVGSLNAGLSGDNKLLFTKSVLDLISSCMLASTLGIGVLFSAFFVLGFQGALVLLAGLLQGVLTDSALVAEITCVGSVMIIGLGLNVLGIAKCKVANMLPAILFVPFVYLAAQHLPL